MRNTGNLPTQHYEGSIQLPSWLILYTSATDVFSVRAGDTVTVKINNDFSTMAEFC